uniref:AAA family ATPase n=1 Tax=Prevotella sp. TaxID=59823 RepID=UPI0040265A18
MLEPKRVPYGVSDFERVIRGNQYYVDKTMYIPLLENQPDNLIFIRPRRFGKSLFLSMLETYYDCKKKDQFQEIFGELWIGSHPTPLQGQFQVLTLDFSQVGGNINNLEERFNSYCGICFDSFVNRYAESYKDIIEKGVYETKVASEKLAMIQKCAKENGYKLYLIIDEYDNFTNTVLNEQGEEVYHAMTHASGFYRDYFKKFKGSFTKIFMMGVSPVTLDDVTSGFNIGWHISTKPEFDKMLGFSTEDVRAMFTRYRDAGQIPADSDIEAMIEEIKPWY